MNFERKVNFWGYFKSDKLPKLTSGELAMGALCAVTAFFMGICPLPLSVYPLGVAFFCAASSTALYAAAGLLTASFFTHLSPIAYFISSLFAILLRILTRLFIDVPIKSSDKPAPKLIFDHVGGNFFCEALPLRAASAAVSVFALSLWSVISGGFRYYDLFGAIFAVITSSAATVIFYGAFKHPEITQPQTKFLSLYKKTSALSVAAMLCLALESLPINGVSLGLAAAFAFTNHFCLRYGLVESCVSSIICGAVCGVQNIPVLIVASFTAYCVLDASPTLAAAVSCIAGTVCGVMLTGSTYMSDPFISLLLGCAVYATLKKLIAEKSDKSTDRLSLTSLDLTSKIRLESLERKIETAQKALADSGARLTSPRFTAQLIKAIENDAEICSSENKQLSRSIARRLYELGFGRVEVTVTGKRQIEIFLCGERLFGRSERLDFIRRRLEETTAMQLTRPKPAEYAGRSALVLRREPLIACRHALSLSAREQVCGDSAEVFLDEERNYLYALICDGMGSGEEAKAISTRALEALKLLLLCGFTPRNAISLLSEELSEFCEDEITTTVDLLALDLYTGEATLCKSGAAPSYLVRKSDIIRLSARTVPMGIIRKSDLREIDLNLSDGDLFIMVSDGVSECENDSLPLLDYLHSYKDNSPEEIAEDIIELSRNLHREDDLSVIAIKIFPQNY